MSPLILDPDSVSHYRSVDNAAGAVFDTGGSVRKYLIHVSGGDVYFRVGDVALLGTDVAFAGAVRGSYFPNNSSTYTSTGSARIAMRTAAGVTADVWITELPA